MQQLRNSEPGARAANTEPLPGSRKVYMDGPRGIRVPLREISLSPTRQADGGIEHNTPIRVYDTSGLTRIPTQK